MSSKHSTIFLGISLFIALFLGFIPAKIQAQDSLWTVFKDESQPDTVRLLALDDIVWNTLYFDLDSAGKLAHLELKLAQEMGQVVWEASACINIAGFYTQKGKLDSSLFYHKKSLQLYKQAGNSFGTTAATNNVGRWFMNNGELDSAMAYLNRGLKLAEAAKDSQRLAFSLRTMASLHRRKGEFIMALEKGRKAMDIFEKGKDSLRMGYGYLLLGGIYQEFEEFETAENMYEKGQELFRRIGHIRGVASISVNGAEILLEKKKYPEAVQKLEEALELYAELGNNPGMGQTHFLLARAYLNSGNLDEAEKNARKSLEILGNTARPKDLSYSHYILGSIHYEKGAFRKAKSEFEIGYKLAEKAEDLAQIIGNATGLGNVENALGNHKKAAFYFKKALDLKKKSLGDENALKIAQMEEKRRYDQIKLADSLKNDEKERTQTLKYEQDMEKQQALTRFGVIAGILGLGFAIWILVLFLQNRRKNKQLTLQNKVINHQKESVQKQSNSLKTALGEKETLLKEIHHRVKNNLQVISSLLELQSNDLESPQALSAIEQGQGRVKAMALIHQFLYQNENLSSLDFQDYIEQLFSQIAGLHPHGKKVKPILHAEGISLDIDTAVPLGLILNELITNAFKYAFANTETGELRIRISQISQGNYELLLSDNGPGLPPGQDPKKIKSLGLRLVRNLSKQLFGSFEYYFDNGSTFKIRFKDSKERRN